MGNVMGGWNLILEYDNGDVLICIDVRRRSMSM